MSTTQDEGTRGEYALDSGSALGVEQLGFLERLLDHQTTGVLAATGIGPGWRCLELGAGGGSIARWLAGRAGPAGSVLAVDLEIGNVDVPPEVQVRRHDLNDGMPGGGPFDLVHARTVLMHLRRREDILRGLVDLLAPGGWLVIGEYVGPQEHLLSAPSRADADLFHRVQDVAHNVVGRGAGVSYEWPREVAGHMTAAGLVDVETIEYVHTSAGGDTAALLSSNYVRQLAEPLLAAGLTVDELDGYHTLMRDPRFRAWFYPYVCARGRNATG